MKKIECPNCKTQHFTNYASTFDKENIYRGKCSKCDTMLRFKIINNENEQYVRESNSISFKVNGLTQNITNEYPLNTKLNDYLRDVMNLRGTKVVCKEGACGSCVVTGKVFDYSTQAYKTVSVNSCLFPLYSADQWEFTTVEGIGNRTTGLHPIQQRLADYNGSQCGYCSPGIVMNMYSLLSNNSKPSKSLIENSFDGHLCRCTGYRSILDAMKSFSADEQPIDIEDLNKLKCLDIKSCVKTNKKTHIINETDEWFAPKTLDELYNLLNEYKTQNYRIVSGNTSTGVYKDDGPFDIFINIQSIPDLYDVKTTNNSLSIGSNINLNKLIEIFTNASTNLQGFEYLSGIASHINKIANVSVRNMGSWAGNVSMKYNHHDFPSDVFTCFETIGALLVINNTDKTTTQVSPSEYLKLDMKGRFISAVITPAYDKTTTFIQTHKIMPRSQNAHAYVNAGFRFTLDPNTFVVKGNPFIVYGGISDSFIHATQTEGFLYGKSLKDQQTIFQAYELLNSEIQPDNDPVLASETYRKSLAISLFYKYILTICNSIVDDRYKSATSSVIDTRPISKGQQEFPTTPDMYPVTKPMTKLNAYAQTSGAAEYVYDMETFPNQLHGTFIPAAIGNCLIDKIDISEAINMPGVVRILLAKDIPGANNCVPPNAQPEPVFADGEVSFAGQGVGLVIAETLDQALKAAKAVKITYKDIKPPLLTMADAIKEKSFHPKPMKDFIYGDADKAIANAPNSVKGNCSLGGQYHFYMESQVAVCRPVDNEFELYSSTQWIDYVLQGAAQVAAVPNSSVHMKAKQIGGGFGGKVTKANLTASAALVAAKLVNRPVRVCLELNECMEMMGKRLPWYAEYDVGFDNDGKLLGVKIDYYSDAGYNPNGQHMWLIDNNFDSAYKCQNWYLTATCVKTNKAGNTACRSPGSFPCISIMEYIVEHVAKYLKKDPLSVKFLNFYKKDDVTPNGQPLPDFNVDKILNSLVATSSYNTRIQEIESFNKANRWKKRGIALIPIKWGTLWTMYFNSFVAIYNGDGSVGVSHGGIECGQGINTKVAQVCAYELQVPMDIISVRHPDGLTEANSIATGGSITSELVCQAIIECCKQLNDRLKPVRDLMPPNYTWKELIQKAFSMRIDLCARYWNAPKQTYPLAYNIYGGAASEALIDVLTGETQILRTDILYDCGQSLNGEIDIGQAEGAFMIGFGNQLFEKLSYDPKSGKLLSNGTWDYYIPTSKDIPQDFRVSLLKDNPFANGVLGSKCIGEPPLCLSISVMFAVKRAIEAARAEINSDQFFVLNSPATVEYVQRSCLVDYSQFKLKD